MSDLNEVALPYKYYPDFSTGRPVANGCIYIGSPDTDPEVATNRLSVRAVQENGTTVTVSQPIRTSAGGVPTVNSSPAELKVDGAYSVKVLNSAGEQVYYAPTVVAGTSPTTLIRSQIVPMSVSLTNRLINNYLYTPNISFQTYYNNNEPSIDLGDISITPFEIEAIPLSRMDLSQGNSTIDLGAL